MKLVWYVLAFSLLFGALGGAPACAQESATAVSDVDFDTSEAPSGGTGTNSIGTNGVISYAAGYNGPATGIVGRINLTSTNGRRIRIGCPRTDQVRNPTGTGGGALNIPVSAVYVVLGTSNAAGPGGGVTCNGTNNFVIDTTFNSAVHDAILIGADLGANNVRFGGQYAASNANGPMTVRVRFSGGSGGGNNTINVPIDLLAVFNGILTLTVNNNMDFGDVDTQGAVGSGTYVDLGTNGARSFAGNFNGTGAGVAGEVTVAGASNGEVLEVYCDSTATLARSGGGGTIGLTGIEAVVEGSTGAYGVGGACNGIAGAAATTFTYQLTTRDQVYFGARLDGATASGSINGSFSTANAGGNNIDVTIIRQ